MDLRTFLTTKAVTAVPLREGRTAYVRPLSVAETTAIDGRTKNLPEADRNRAAASWMLLFGVCDEQGNRVFADDDYPRIDEMPAGLFSELIEALTAVCGRSGDDAKKS